MRFNTRWATLLVATTLLTPSCDKRSTLPNVVLLVMDTARADHFSCYGYHRKTSPDIDSLSHVATRYEQAIAPAPWTLPTHASLFTGKNSFEHGARTYEELSEAPNNARPLPEEHVTLAEALRALGYHTGGFVANKAFAGPGWGLERGFATYVAHPGKGDGVNSAALAWLDSVKTGPFFLFVNYMDTHGYYNTTPRHGVVMWSVRHERKLLDRVYDVVMAGNQPAPGDLLQQLVDQYDTAIANVDLHVGRLVDQLRARGLYQNTIIIVTADHGEFLGEHGLMTHSKDVYQEVARVPLVIKSPFQTTPSVVSEPTSLTVIPRLILAQLPADRIARYDPYFPNAPGKQPVLCENYYSRPKDLNHEVWGHRFRRIRTAVYDGPFKYIDSSDGLSELYNLQEDPSESQNLYDARPEVVAKMRSMIEDYKKTRSPSISTQTKELTEDDIKRLKSLGYLAH
jgi:arylsulfatase A-like enzyme